MTPQSLEFKLSVLLIREEEMWVAQCLEYDIVAQGRTIADVKQAFAKTFAGQVVVDIQNNVQPLEGFKAAPMERWRQFDRAERLADRQPLHVPSLPPAFMIHAMADDVRISA